MRVALVAWWFNEYCVAQASALARHAQVFLCFAEGKLGRAKEALSPRVHHVPVPMPPSRSPRNLMIVPDLVRILRRINPDVIHVHQSGHARLMLAMPFLRRYPLVVTVHDPTQHSGEHTWVATWADRRARARGDHFLLHGRHMCGMFEQIHGITRERMTPISHGVLDYSLWRDEAAPPLAQGHALLFGRMKPYKGVGVLIEAAARLRSAPPGFKIVIAGRGDSLDPHRRRAAELHLGERVVFMEQFIPEPQVDALHRHARVIVLPYTEATQSGPAATACAYGKPIIASDTGGLPEVVRDGQTGLLVPPGDPDALALALDRIASDDALAQTLGEGARRLGETELSWEALAPQTIAAYERAIAARRRRLGEA